MCAANQEERNRPGTFLEAYLKRYPEEATRAGLHDHDAYLTSFHSDDIGEWMQQLKQWEPAPSSNGPITALNTAVLQFHIAWERFLYERMGYPLRDPSYAYRRLAMALAIPLSRPYAPLAERLEAVRARLEGTGWYLDFASSGHAPAFCTENPPPRFTIEMAQRDVEGLIEFVKGSMEAAFNGSRTDEGGPSELSTGNARCLAQAASALFMERNHLMRVVGTASTFSEVRWGSERLQLAIDILSNSTGGYGESSIRFGEMRNRAEEELETVRTELRQTAREIDTSHPPAAVIAGIDTQIPNPDSLLEWTRNAVAEASEFLASERLLPTAPRTIIVEPAPEFLGGQPDSRICPPGPLEPPDTPAVLWIAPPHPGWKRARIEKHLAAFSRARLPLIAAHALAHTPAIPHTANHSGQPLRAILPVPTLEYGWPAHFVALAVREGLADGDPRVRIAMLDRRRLALLRFLTAIAIHSGKTYPEPAAGRLAVDGDIDPRDADREAREISRDPLPAIAEVLGDWQIRALQERVRTSWKTDYNHGRFHQALFEYGYAPVPLLEPVLEQLTKS